MAPSLRVLFVEDSENDAELIVRALRVAGYDPVAARVDTPEAFQMALARERWDVVVSDHAMPRFSSMAALELMQHQDVDLPFIVVSGSMDEDTAVTILRAGAHDFVTKQNLTRLGPAVGRELKEAKNRAERRIAQQDLRDQRDLLRLVIDTNPNLIFVKDWDGRFTLANQAVADLYGTTVSQLFGKTEADFLPDGGDAEPSRREDQEIMASGTARVTQGESIMDVRRGTLRWFAMRRVPLIPPDGSGRQLLGIGTDITERKLTEEALRATEEQFRHAQKMEAVGQLAGGIAHDFNNLLTVILGFSDLVLDHLRDQPDLSADVEEISRAGHRATLLTRQLLAFSRKQVLTPQVLDVNKLVVELDKMLRRVIGEHIAFVTILIPSICLVKADPGQIEQVLMNLAVNARDAMPSGGTLTIESARNMPPASLVQVQGAKQAESYVSLTVSDSGEGMSPEVRNRIFEPFFTTKGPG